MIGRKLDLSRNVSHHEVGDVALESAGATELRQALPGCELQGAPGRGRRVLRLRWRRTHRDRRDHLRPPRPLGGSDPARWRGGADSAHPQDAIPAWHLPRSRGPQGAGARSRNELPPTTSPCRRSTTIFFGGGDRRALRPATGPRSRSSTSTATSSISAQPGWRQTVGNLSGGNQQKIVIEQMAVGCIPACSSSTNRPGVSMWARNRKSHNLIRDLAAQGYAVVVISSEMPEGAACLDRIVAMYSGRYHARVTSRGSHRGQSDPGDFGHRRRQGGLMRVGFCRSWPHGPAHGGKPCEGGPRRDGVEPLARKGARRFHGKPARGGRHAARARRALRSGRHQCLPTTSLPRAVHLGENGLLAAGGAKVFLEMGTMSPRPHRFPRRCRA